MIFSENKEQPQSGSNDAEQQFIALLQQHLDVLAIGLSVMHRGVPPHLFAPALAEAMGRVISGATATPDVGLTLRLREQARKAFETSLKKTVPALAPVSPMSKVAS